MKPLRTLAAAGAFAAVIAVTPPASAHTDYEIWTAGSGTISPGLTLVPTFQDVDWTANILVGVGHNGTTIVATGCMFSGGSSIPETDLTGAGSGVLSSCSGVNMSGSIQYNRQLNVVTLSGFVSVNGSTHRIDNNECEFTPTSSTPTMSFYLECAVQLIER